MTIYEIWFDFEEGVRCIAFFPEENRDQNCRIMSKDAVLWRTVEAASWEEAMAKYHEIMGWEPYRPMLDSEEL